MTHHTINNYSNVPYPVIELTEARINRTPEIELLNISNQQLMQSNILEIGSGTGRLAVNLINNCTSYLGIEKSASMLLACINRMEASKLQTKFTKCFLHGEFLDVDFHDNKFDIILLTDFILCYQNNYINIGQLLKKIQFISSATGIILLDIPIISKRMKKDLSSDEVKYNCTYDNSTIEVIRRFKKNGTRNYTFLYEAIHKNSRLLSVKYTWQLDFFYPEKEAIIEMIHTIYPSSKVNEIVYENDSMESIFYLIKL